jgi:RNA polymerase sigma-70 factor (ECF subfamily)
LERQQFEELALEHLDAVYRMALQLSRHPDEAADLVQETYLKALKAAKGFREQGGGMRPWLFKILHNAFFTRVSKAKRERTAGDDLLSTPATGAAPDEPGPAWDLASLDWEQVDQRIKAAIEHLRPEYRGILLMWGVEGMKYREIADTLDIPIGTVMSRLHRARSMLADELSEFAEENRLTEG